MPTVTLNEGLAVFALCWLGFAAWKFGWYIVYAILGNENKQKPGLAGEALAEGRKFVASTLDLHETLRETQRSQAESSKMQAVNCQVHASGLSAISQLIESQVAIGVTARDQAIRAASQAAEGNQSLAHIDQTLTDRTQLLVATAHGVAQLKAVALSNCEMCRKVANQLSSQFPSVAAEIGPHCDAIKKKLEETA